MDWRATRGTPIFRASLVQTSGALRPLHSANLRVAYDAATAPSVWVRGLLGVAEIKSSELFSSLFKQLH